MTSQLATEISVTVKDDNCRITEKEIYYGELHIAINSEAIQSLVVKAITKLGTHPYSEPPEIIVKTKTVWQ